MKSRGRQPPRAVNRRGPHDTSAVVNHDALTSGQTAYRLKEIDDDTFAHTGDATRHRQGMRAHLNQNLVHEWAMPDRVDRLDAIDVQQRRRAERDDARLCVDVDDVPWRPPGDSKSATLTNGVAEGSLMLTQNVSAG